MEDWAMGAACRGHDPALFFPRTPGEGRRGLAICAHCPVRQPCRADYQPGEIYEVRGGEVLGGRLSRPLVLVDRRRRAADPSCGTDGGYSRHRRDGTPACSACRAAHARREALRAMERRALGLDPPASRRYRSTGEKLEIVAYAAEHGVHAAARKYGVTRSSVRTWRRGESLQGRRRKE